MKRLYKTWAIALIAVMLLSAANIQAQSPTGSKAPGSANRNFNAKSLFGFTRFPLSGNQLVAANNAAATTSGTNFPVIGSGTTGRLTKLTGFNGSNFVIGDSIIFEDKFAKVGIGTDTPTSKLTVQGMIETTLGGLKFPDGTVQTTAALSGMNAVFHDATLQGAGTSASPLAIAPGGVGTTQLSNNAVTGAKLAQGTAVRSLNGLADNVSIQAGSNISVTPGAGTLTIAATGMLSTVTHDATLSGTGTAASPLGIANNAVGTSQLADQAVTTNKIATDAVGTSQLASGAVTANKIAAQAVGTASLADNGVTAAKIATGQVVKSFNGLKDNVMLVAGSNVTITPSGNTLTIAASGASSSGTVFHDNSLKGDGVNTALGVNVPLTLNGAADAVISTSNSVAGGYGVKATGGATGIGVYATCNIDDSRAGGTAVVAVGGSSGSANAGGIGVNVLGGGSDTGFGGDGVFIVGGNSNHNSGGRGLFVQGGIGADAGHSGGIGIEAFGGLAGNGATPGKAGVFHGDVQVTGMLAKGGGSFKIDHPLDPENKYLYHSFVESPDMMNIYNGNITTNESGEAVVELPDYFEALNKDFRYQLTVIGQFAQAIVADEIKGSRFVIRTNAPNVKVSWQVTGVRHDAWANQNRIPVEAAKSERERGYYLHPAALNQPEEKGIEWARNPELMQQMKEQRAKQAEALRQPPPQ